MNKKYFKDFALLIGVIAISAITARIMAGGETLEEYASKNPEAAGISSTINESDSSTEDFSAEAVSLTSNEGNTMDKNINSSLDSTMESALDSTTDISLDTTTDSKSDIVIYQDGFYYEPISNDVFKRISGVSYPVDCTVPLDDLRYLVLKYVDFNGDTQNGEIICNKTIADDLMEIFFELYQSGYQIESIRLIDEFDGDDTASMLANNTSCFNYRVVEGTTRLSNHAKGLAIDLNPFYNPYITYNKDGSVNISPEGSEAYADRNASFPYKIDENDLAYKLFKEHGFKWGGNWNSVKDYQHFERPS